MSRPPPAYAPPTIYDGAGWLGPPPPAAAPPPPPPHYQQQPQQQQQPQWGVPAPGYGAPPPPAPFQQQHQQRAPPPPQQQQPPPQQRRRKALLIGCCYAGTSAALSGCINDTQMLAFCLKKNFGLTDADMVVLRDDERRPDFVPTRFNIFRAIQWLVGDQRPGDSLWFSFSGHGSQRRDYDGDEADGLDETILPCDHARAGQIVDDELNAALVAPLRPGVTLHAVIDACHSGSAFDLPFETRVDQGGRFYWKGAPPTRRPKGTAGGTAFQLGACKDSQVAADTNRMSGSAYTGAATYAFIDAVERYGPSQTYATLLAHMHESLHRHVGGGGGNAVGGGGLGGLVASFLLGPALLGGGGGGGGQTPVMACDKPLDLYAVRLCF